MKTKSQSTVVRGLFEDSQAGIAGHGLRLILGTAVGLLLLALAIQGVNWPQVGSALAEANYPLLTLALGTVLLTTLAKAARWRLLFPQGHNRPGLIKLFSMLLIGQTVNALRKENYDLSRTKTATTLAAEEATDS